MIDLFEVAMRFAEIVDNIKSRHQMALGALIMLIAILAAYVAMPAPPHPEAPLPENKAVDIGLETSLQWSEPRYPIPFVTQFGPNSQVSYDVWMGTEGDGLKLVGRANGGKGGNISHSLAHPLTPETAYLWHITATNRIYKTTSGPLWKFSTMPLPAIVRFESDRSTVDLGEPVTLSWSATNATKVTLEPLGLVPLAGTRIHIPSKNTVYTLTAQNEIGEDSASISATLLRAQMIDPMDDGWRAYRDQMGSTEINIAPTKGRTREALDMSYYLVRDGWAGVSKNISKSLENVSRAEQIGFFYKSGGAQTAIEMRLTDRNGTTFGYSWGVVPTSSEWRALRAELDDFECWHPGAGARCDDEKLDLNNVINLGFFVSDEVGRREGSSGWTAIDDVQTFNQT